MLFRLKFVYLRGYILETTVCIKKLNRFEIALNFAKYLFVSVFFIYRVYQTKTDFVQ